MTSRRQRPFPAEMPQKARPPRGAAAVSLLVVLVMAGSVIFVWEPWPFTSFRLFSTTRTAVQGTWEAAASLPGGRSWGFDLAALPHGFRGFQFTMNDFPKLQNAERTAVCRTWLGAAQQHFGVPVTRLTMSRRTWDLSADETIDRGSTSSPQWICSPSGAAPIR